MIRDAVMLCTEQELSRANDLAASSVNELSALSAASANLQQTIAAHTASAERLSTVLNAMSDHSERVRRGHTFLRLVKDIERVSSEAKTSAEIAAGIITATAANATAKPTPNAASTGSAGDNASDADGTTASNSDAAASADLSAYHTASLLPIGQAMRLFRRFFALFRFTLQPPTAQLRVNRPSFLLSCSLPTAASPHSVDGVIWRRRCAVSDYDI